MSSNFRESSNPGNLGEADPGFGGGEDQPRRFALPLDDGSRDSVRVKAFLHELVRRDNKLVGVIRLRNCVRNVMDEASADFGALLDPKLPPMVIKPLPWRTHDEGGFLP